MAQALRIKFDAMQPSPDKPINTRYVKILRFIPAIVRLIRLMIVLGSFTGFTLASAYAADLGRCAIGFGSALCMAGDTACSARMGAKIPDMDDTYLVQRGVLAPRLRMAGDADCRMKAASAVAGGSGQNTRIPNEKLSFYKTISYVTGATLTDQIWYLTIASEAAATGGIFFVVNAATSAMMTYNYEYYWNICCRAPPGPDGIVPVSASKAIIYRGLSIIRVGALALIFGNTLPSAALVTFAITLSRTAVYVTNDYVWNRIEVMSPAPSDPIH